MNQIVPVLSPVPVEIKITNPDIHKFGGLPRRQTQGAAAYDLAAMNVFGKKAGNKPDTSKCHDIPEDGVVIQPGCVEYFGVGFDLHILNPIFCAHIIPRSGSAASGFAMGNTVGLIDSDYTGSLIVAAFNRYTDRLIIVQRGERIAQMYYGLSLVGDHKIVDEFSNITERGAGGFGSTGR